MRLIHSKRASEGAGLGYCFLLIVVIQIPSVAPKRLGRRSSTVVQRAPSLPNWLPNVLPSLHSNFAMILPSFEYIRR